MKYYKVLKLSNGDDVIGLIDGEYDDPTVYRIEKPLTIYNMTLDNGSTALYLKSYSVLCNSDFASIFKNQVISSYTPSPTFINFYDVMVQYSELFSIPETIAGATAATLILQDAIKRKLRGEKDDLPTSKSKLTPKNKVTH
jgi:hypothetical protein